MSFCRNAAKQNYPPAQFCVGYLYEHGLGSPADPKEAAKWYQQAITFGHPLAMMNLAEMEWKGDGVRADRPEAYYLFFRAYQKGAPNAKARAQVLWGEMSKDEIKRLDNKLRDMHIDPQKIFAIMQNSTSPAAARQR
jgi:hypothetical protein